MKILLPLALLLLATPAQAHKLKLFATVEGPVILGTAYFSGGDKAVGVGGVVRMADGSMAGEVRTDQDGAFRFEVRSRTDHSVTMDGGDGHMATVTIGAAELPQTLPAGPAALPTPPPLPAVAGLDAVEAAVARQIRPLRQQLDAYEDKVRLHDIMGGVGTIFGIFGIAAWVSARRRSPS
ncbi:MAG: hypothetical protein Q7R40_05855 [Phaeospirillum sp.]|nr:hypothetical protein [Phaeospirillum sp.]